MSVPKPDIIRPFEVESSMIEPSMVESPVIKPSIHSESKSILQALNDVLPSGLVNGFPKMKPEFDHKSRKKVLEKKRSPPRKVNDPNNLQLADLLIMSYISFKIIEDKTPFKWDGSHLGRICGDNILEIFEYGGIKYWRINIAGHEEVCITRSINHNIPLICDELKPYFSLPKLGTHSVTYNSKKILLIKARLDKSGDIIEEITIDKVDPNKNERFLQRVREIYVFREVLGLIMTRDKSIVVRWSNEKYIPPYPVSFYESDMRPYAEKEVISGVAERRWFKSVSQNDVLRSMLKIENNQDVMQRLGFIRNRLDEVIERIDRDMVWIIQPIIEKLTRKMLLGIKSENLI